MDKQQFINRVSASVHDSDPEAEVYLYGSRARGDNSPDSDWDLLILVSDKKVTNETEDRFRDRLFDIELDTGQIISTLIYPKDYWNDKMSITPLFENVAKEGILI
jgi:predicted nucleotidyltransferase